MSKKFTVEEQFILEAHNAACNEWKEKIEEQFPELFGNGAFRFKEEDSLSFSSGKLPFFIGRGLAPGGLKDKCLIVDNRFKMEIEEYRGNQILIFRKKQ